MIVLLLKQELVINNYEKLNIQNNLAILAGLLVLVPLFENPLNFLTN